MLKTMPDDPIICSATFLPSAMALIAVDAPRNASPPMKTFPILVLYVFVSATESRWL